MQESHISNARREQWREISQKIVLKGPISHATLVEMFLTSPTGKKLMKEISIVNPRVISIYQSTISNGEMKMKIEKFSKVIYVAGDCYLAAIDVDGEIMKIDFVDLR